MSHKAGLQLKKLMNEADIDDLRLSQLTGVAKSNISRLKNDPDSNPTLATLKPIADYFAITVSQLLGEVPIATQGAQDESGVIITQVPKIAWDEIQSFIRDKHQLLQLASISTDRVVSTDAFAVTVMDSTLMPIFPKGALLVVEPNQTPADGSHILMMTSAKAKPCLRQYLQDGETVLLKSLKAGTNWMEPLESQHQIIGVVLEVRYQLEDLNAASSTVVSAVPAFSKKA